MSLQVEKESFGQVASVDVISLLVATHLEQGADNMEAIAEVFERLGLLVWIVGPLREVIHDALAVAIFFLRS